MKTCIICNLEKDRSLFHKCGFENGKQKYRSVCKTCTKPLTKEKYHENRTVHRQRTRNSQLKLMYGINSEQYAVMQQEQDNKCFICGEEDNRRLSVDHCHTTGNVRKLLCGACNLGLGKFKDNPQLLIKAAEYIKNHES
jgi:hypothetical protein